MRQDNWPPRFFHVMLKPQGAICNLGCRYCYYLDKEKLYPSSNFRMSTETLETFTQAYIAAQRVPEVTFAWQGGEPTLMGLEFFKKAVALQNKYKSPGMRIQNAFQTNGVLLDDDWCRFFYQNNFLIGLSLDGPQPLHDTYRMDKGGHSTFERVIAGLKLLKQFNVDFNILACVHASNVDHPQEVYRFFRDEIRAEFIQFIPIIEYTKSVNQEEGFLVTQRSVSGKQYGHFLNSIFDEWVRKDVGRVFVQIFDAALGAWSGLPVGLCTFSEACGDALVMEHNGDLYSCDHTVDPAHLLGNIHEKRLLDMVTSPSQVLFGESKYTSLPQYCQRCSFRFACNGGCQQNRILQTPDGEKGLNYLCEGYQAFFNHIDSPMKHMVQLLRMGRPPAEIMNQF